MNNGRADSAAGGQADPLSAVVAVLVEALRALSLNGAAQLETMNKIIGIVEKQGDIGKRAIEAVTATNDAILKAASKTPQTVINDTHLTQQEAELR